MEEYKFSTYWKNEKTSDVVISADRKGVFYKKYTSKIPQVPFLFDKPSIGQMYDFLKSRCMDERRGQLDEYLEDLGLAEYNPWEIVRKTHGVMWEDFLWIKFPDEDICWEDVKIRD